MNVQYCVGIVFVAWPYVEVVQIGFSWGFGWYFDSKQVRFRYQISFMPRIEAWPVFPIIM